MLVLVLAVTVDFITTMLEQLVFHAQQLPLIVVNAVKFLPQKHALSVLLDSLLLLKLVCSQLRLPLNYCSSLLLSYFEEIASLQLAFGSFLLLCFWEEFEIS